MTKGIKCIKTPKKALLENPYIIYKDNATPLGACPSGVDKCIKRIKKRAKTEGERMNYANFKTNGDCHRR